MQTCYLCGYSPEESDLSVCPVCGAEAPASKQERLVLSNPCKFFSTSITSAEGTVLFTDRRIVLLYGDAPFQAASQLAFSHPWSDLQRVEQAAGGLLFVLKNESYFSLIPRAHASVGMWQLCASSLLAKSPPPPGPQNAEPPAPQQPEVVLRTDACRFQLKGKSICSGKATLTSSRILLSPRNAPLPGGSGRSHTLRGLLGRPFPTGSAARQTIVFPLRDIVKIREYPNGFTFQTKKGSICSIAFLSGCHSWRDLLPGKPAARP